MDGYFYVYIMANRTNRVLYVGVTNDLQRRSFEHRTHAVDGFTKRYNVTKLVYYEVAEDAYSAITREKQLKGGSRAAKVALINLMNREWTDLYETL